MDDPSISRKTLIERCPVVQTNVRWPVPVDQRLNELLDRLLESSTGDVTRSGLLAAIVASAPTNARELDELVRRYRTLTAGAIVLQQRGAIVCQERKPGRRGTRS